MLPTHSLRVLERTWCLEWLAGARCPLRVDGLSLPVLPLACFLPTYPVTLTHAQSQHAANQAHTHPPPEVLVRRDRVYDIASPTRTVRASSFEVLSADELMAVEAAAHSSDPTPMPSGNTTPRVLSAAPSPAPSTRAAAHTRSLSAPVLLVQAAPAPAHAAAAAEASKRSSDKQRAPGAPEPGPAVADNLAPAMRERIDTIARQCKYFVGLYTSKESPAKHLLGGRAGNFVIYHMAHDSDILRLVCRDREHLQEYLIKCDPSVGGCDLLCREGVDVAESTCTDFRIVFIFNSACDKRVTNAAARPACQWLIDVLHITVGPSRILCSACARRATAAALCRRGLGQA
jgi:hypothetical protein